MRSPRSPVRDEVLIAVEAAGVSHADVMQRAGNYPPPPGASQILGLEVAGTIAATGARRYPMEGRRSRLRADRRRRLRRIRRRRCRTSAADSAGWSAVEAATLPENAFTVYDNLFTRARLRAGETVLVHGGTSGIGSTAIMFATRTRSDRTRDRRYAREVRGLRTARSRCGHQLPHDRFRGGGAAPYRRARRRRRARHRRRRLRCARPRSYRARWKNRVPGDARANESCSSI